MRIEHLVYSIIAHLSKNLNEKYRKAAWKVILRLEILKRAL